MDTLLDGLTQLPESSGLALDKERVDQMRTSIAEAAKSAKDLTALLGTAEKKGNEEIDAVATMSRMEQLLGQVIGWIDDFQTKAVRIHAEVAALRPRIDYWMRNGPIVITCLLTWFAISQFFVIAQVRSWFKS